MRRTVLLASALCLLLTLIAFGRSLTQDFAPLDDDLLITRNLAVRGMTVEHLKTVFTTYDPELYIPLTFVSYQINYLIGGLHPWMYHLTNILLHAGNALLVMWIVFLLTARTGATVLRPYIIVVVGLIFAVHPLNTEAVVWLAGRKDLLSTMFFLAAWIAYMKYRKRVWDKERASPRDAPTYTLGVVLFAMALLAKVMAVTLPAILILTDLWIEKRKWSLSMLIDKIPYFVLSGIFLVVATAGKERILAQHSIMETSLMAAKSTVFYLQKFVLPIHLGVFYPYRGEISLLLPAFFVPVMILLLIGILVITVAKYGSTPLTTGGRSEDSRVMFFGILFFLVTLAPTFTNFHKGGEMYFASDRYPYLPQIGLLFLVVMMISFIWERGAPSGRPYTRTWVRYGSVGIIAILTILSLLQTRIWDSARTLFSNTLTLYPQSVAARSALATMDKNEGRYEQAIKLLRDGLGYGDNAQLRMSLGTVYAKIGRVEDAADQFNRALTLEPDNPEPLVALGVLDEYNKKTADAKEKYRRAVEMDSSYVSARNKLGSLLLEEGNIADADVQFRAALQWNPNADGVLYNLSLILDRQKKPDEALAALERAYALNPDSPAIILALAEHLMRTDPARAETLLRDVVKMDPKNADAERLLKQLQTRQ